MTITNYTVTRDDIILGALRKCGVVEPGDTIANVDSNIVSNCAFVLNLMLKQWAVDGLKLWTIVENVLPLVANQTSYTIGPAGPDLTTDKPLKVIQAWLRNTQVTPNIDTPMQLISKQEYNILGSKATTGVANSLYYDPRVTFGIMNVYLTPDTATSTNYQLHFIGQRLIGTINAGTDTFDLPIEWMQACLWNLADQLAIENDVPANHRQEIGAKAGMYRDQLMGFDVEEASTFFTPDMRAGMIGR